MTSAGMRVARAVPVLAAALIPQVAAAREDTQLWTSQRLQAGLGGGIEVTLETAVRFGDAAQGLNQVRIAPSIGYDISKRVALYLGYVDAPDYARGRTTDVEQRLREQVGVDLGHVLGGRVSTLVRLEERWRSTGRDTGWRGRAQVRWARPLGGMRAPDLVVSHESFVTFNATDWGQHAGYDRMRNYVGLSQPLGHVTLEGGYLNQRIYPRAGPLESDNIALLGVSLKL